MALKIRLARAGSKKRPFYHIVVADARSPRDGRFIERIGSYNPMLAKDSEDRVKLDAERAEHWLKVGAQATDRVARFLDTAGLMKRTAKNNPKKAVPGEKAKERAEARAAKAEELKKAESAPAKAEEPAEAPAEEAPVEEAAAETPAEETPAPEAEAPAAEAEAEAPEAEAETKAE